MPRERQIRVTSHVSRDFLQNAAYFNTLPKIVWEYVANSLDAAKDGVQAVVAVEISSRYIKISDNGRGMSREELHNFFQMHGENIQRRRGRRVRGRFGTGKSAAFGLANSLRIDTSQNGIRNVVELTRKDIESVSGEAFPVRDIVVDGAAPGDDGTTVEIRDFNTPSLAVDKVKSYVEKHLSRYRQRAYVTINGHECKFTELSHVRKVECLPPSEVAQHIGQVALEIKISPVPLDDETRGIDILSYGIWHGTTLAGLERKDRASYLFGQIDVPILEDGDWPIPAFDNTRNNTLNLQNPIVAVLLGWISEELEKVRFELLEDERRRRNSETAKKLAEEAERISSILNEDFAQQEIELELTQRVAKRSGGRSVQEILDDKGDLAPGNGDLPTDLAQAGASHGKGRRGTEAGVGNEPRPGPNIIPGSEAGSRKNTTDGTRKRRKAVFSLEYKHETAEQKRSRYDTESKTIIVNLDHPQISGAFDAGGRQSDSRHFREICYEVAVVEYAIALQHEAGRTSVQTGDEALYDVRETVDRLSRRFANLLRA